MPPEVADVISYYNIPVEASPNATANPLRALRHLARPDDFVVFKLDIDAATLEADFLSQILGDPQLAALIDELYFEHHVHQSPVEHQAHKYMAVMSPH